MLKIKLLPLLVALLVYQMHVSDAKPKCSELEKEEECSETEYGSYVECMRKRVKRGTDCEMDEECDGSPGCSGGTNNDCDECDCNYCSYNNCESSCQSCCADTPPPCENRSCCQSTCHSQCRTSSCRRSCRTSCQSKIPGASGGSSSGSSSSGSGTSKVQSNVASNHNITTIINLHNMINNTNIIDTPIHINNTNYNNLTLIPSFTSETGAQTFPTGPIAPDPGSEPIPGVPTVRNDCCKIIGPRQCTPISIPPFQKCFHYRKAHCGEICKTSIMHAEHHEVCDQVTPPTCHQQIAYYPQPQPRCSYTSSWPYVRCGIEKPNCNGCYGHISKGSEPPSKCSTSCYDEGYDVGPMYRQAPAYRPNYMPTPPCEYTGSCGGYGGGGGGGYGGGAFSGGGFGGEYGYAGNAPYANYPYPQNSNPEFQYQIELNNTIPNDSNADLSKYSPYGRQYDGFEAGVIDNHKRESDEKYDGIEASVINHKLDSDNMEDFKEDTDKENP